MAQSVEAIEQGHSGGRAAAMTLFAAGLTTAAILGTVLGLALSLSTIGAPDPVRQEPVGAVATFGWVLILTAVGLVLRRHRADHPIALLFLGFGAAAGLSHALWGALVVQRLPGGDPQLAQGLALLAATLPPASWSYLLGVLILLFPSGHAETRFDGRLLRAMTVVCLTLGVLLALRPGRYLVVPAYTNPLSVPEPLQGPLILASNLASLAVLALGALAAWRMAQRYRHATLEGRLQLRWFAYAATVAILGGAVFIVGGSLLGAGNPAFRDLTYTIAIVCASSLPIAVLEAVTRHRLYEIDRIIGRTFAYGALTAILAGLYAGSVRLFQGIFIAVTGDESDAALVLTTLVLATTFTPIKSRLEKMAEKRFKPAEPAGVEVPAVPPPGERSMATTFSAEQLEIIDTRVEAAVRRVLAEPAGKAGKERPPSR